MFILYPEWGPHSGRAPRASKTQLDDSEDTSRFQTSRGVMFKLLTFCLGWSSDACSDQYSFLSDTASLASILRCIVAVILRSAVKTITVLDTKA